MERDKKGRGESGPSNEQFLEEIFREVEQGNTLVFSFTGDPADQTVWPAAVWRPGYDWEPDANNYGVVSTFTGRRRRKADFVALQVVMIDDVVLRPDKPDVGGKIPKANITLPPTWAIETSPNNAQLGYKLSEPITQLHIATRLIAGIQERVTAGGADPGMAGVTRYFKLPQGVNGKAQARGWRNRCRLYKPDRSYSLRELCDAFDLDLEEIEKDVRPELFDADKYPEGGPVVDALDWYAQEHGGMKEETDEAVHITCPWVSEHSENRDDGTAVGKPGTHPEIPGFWFKCHHGHCQDKKLADFMTWCRDNGFGKTSAAEDFKDHIPEVDEDDTPRFSTFSWDDATTAGAPPRQLVEDFLLFKNSSLVSAQPNTGKSAFALDLAIAVASGSTWNEKSTTQAGVLYVAAESPGSIRTRILGHKAIDNAERLPLAVVQERISLAEESARQAFRRKMIAYKQDNPALGLVIVDTFRSASAGVEENAAEAIGPIVSDLHEIAHRLDLHLMIVHHTTKAGATYSGSGVFGAIVDTEVIINDETDLGEEGNRGCLVARVIQQRELGSKMDEYFYRIQGVETGRTNNFNKPETAPVVVQLSPAALDFEREQRLEAEQEASGRQAAADLDEYLAAAREFGTLSARTLFDRADCLVGWPLRRVMRARDAAVEDGAILRQGNHYSWAP